MKNCCWENTYRPKILFCTALCYIFFECSNIYLIKLYFTTFSLRWRMEKSCCSRCCRCVKIIKSCHSWSRNTTTYTDCPIRSTTDSITAHVSSDNSGVHTQWFCTTWFNPLYRWSTWSSLHTIWCRIHELCRPSCDATAHWIRNSGSFRWVICTLTRILLDSFVHFLGTIYTYRCYIFVDIYYIPCICKTIHILWWLEMLYIINMFMMSWTLKKKRL